MIVRWIVLGSLCLVLAGACGRGTAGPAADIPEPDETVDGGDASPDSAGTREIAGGDLLEVSGEVTAPDTTDTVDDALSDASIEDMLQDSPEVFPDAADSVTPPDIEPETTAPTQADPATWGPHQVGTTSFQWFDFERLRLVPTTVWYPAIPMGQPKATYLVVIPGNAYTNAPQDASGAPYPVVLFSHGFRGTAVQSITFTEYLASHGYVVAAMDHSGNTLTDFFADDEKVAEVALERPYDVKFAYYKLLEFVTPGTALLSGMMDPERVGVCGHSFGGYTALVVAGAVVDVTQAQAACAAGAPSDIFCDYVGYWPTGTTVGLTPPIPDLKAAASFAPGGYSAFGDHGLDSVSVPALIFGGTLDDTCPVDVEIDPIYQHLPSPKGKAVITDASHMSFTNICDIPLAQQFLADYCDVPGIISEEKGFDIMNTLTVAFFDRYLKNQETWFDDISQDYADDAWGCVQVTTAW